MSTHREEGTAGLAPEPPSGPGSSVNVCPECRNLKCGNCTGWAINETTDEVGNCECPEPAHPWNNHHKVGDVIL